MHARTLLIPCLTLMALAGCNSAPEGLGITLGPDAPSTLDDLVVTLSPAAVDPNSSDTVEHRYVWSVDNGRMDGLTTDTVSSGETRKGQVWKVVVTPWDGKLSGTAAEASVTILNTAPTATVSITPEAPKTEDRIRSSIDTHDIDNDLTNVRYQWSLNGSVTSLTNDTLPPNRTNKGELWELAVFPNDGEVDGEPATVEFTIANTAPSLTKASVDPSIVTAATDMTCRGQGWQDVDEDEPGYETEWFLNGVSTSTADVLPGLAVRRGDEVACQLTPHDGDDAGEPVRSTSVIVRNAPPSLDSVTIAPDEPTADQTVEPTVGTAADLDGDEITYHYSWRINGREVGTGDNLPGSRFIKNDKITLQITPDDGYDLGAVVVSNQVTAGNNLPEITGLTLPKEIFTDTAFTIEAHTSDHDGDDVDIHVEWYVNSKKVTETSSTLDGKTWFDKGDTVYAIVTPDDRDDEGPSVTTSTFTVQNSPPSLAVISIDPKQPETDDDLVCQIDKDSVDPDGDKFSYTLHWEKDGKRWAGKTATTTLAGDTIPSTETAGDGQEWACHVVASDGSASTDAVVRINVGGFVTGFKGEIGPTLPGYLQCEGYLDKTGGDHVPKAWGNDCMSTKYDNIAIACGSSKTKYRYIEVKKNVFRDKLKSYPETGLITSMKDQAGTSISMSSNYIYATGNDPHNSRSWWVTGSGCGESNVSLTVNNSCTYEASNCFGQGISGDRYLWVYVKP